MIAPLSLSNVMIVVLAAICLYLSAAQSYGLTIRAWRLALPPCFAAAVAFGLLESVFESSLLHDAEWLVAAAAGLVVGRLRGWSIGLEVDQRHGLVRLRRSPDAPLVAIGLLLLGLADGLGAALQEPLIDPPYLAAGAALCAGYLGGRALAIAVRATRLPHVELRST